MKLGKYFPKEAWTCHGHIMVNRTDAKQRSTGWLDIIVSVMYTFIKNQIQCTSKHIMQKNIVNITQTGTRGHWRDSGTDRNSEITY